MTLGSHPMSRFPHMCLPPSVESSSPLQAMFVVGRCICPFLSSLIARGSAFSASTLAPTSSCQDTPLKKTALHALHVELGGKMVPFAGYSMPVQYPDGILTSHIHVREKSGLFDVSHMGQLKYAFLSASSSLRSRFDSFGV